MKITKEQLKQIIKEEIEKQAGIAPQLQEAELTREQLVDALAAKFAVHLGEIKGKATAENLGADTSITDQTLAAMAFGEEEKV